MNARAKIPPPLVTGDQFDDEEYLRRYWAMPDTKAELVDGRVIVASPVSLAHNLSANIFVFWTGCYQAHTPGLGGLCNGTVRMRPGLIPQPDGGLFVRAESGGTVHQGADDLLAGVPELVIEIAVSSAARDRGQKRRAYQRAGVAELMVVRPRRQEIAWEANGPAGLTPLAPDEAGVWRSRMFPGLWLDQAALWGQDYAALQATVQRGCRTPEHAAFVARLQAAASQHAATSEQS